MAGFIFYCVAADYPALIEAVCQGSVYGIVPLWHRSNKVVVYHGYSDELAAALKVNKAFYVLGDFSTEGVYLDKEAADSYSVSMERCGPLIAVALPGTKKQGYYEYFWAGDVWYRSWYLTKNGDTVKPSAELKDAYRDVVGRVKKLCCRIHFGKALFVTEYVHGMLERGRAKVQIEGRWVSKN